MNLNLNLVFFKSMNLNLNLKIKTKRMDPTSAVAKGGGVTAVCAPILVY